MTRRIVLWLISIIFLFLAISSIIGWMVSAPRYRGEKTDHFDGRKFINPGQVEAKGFKDLMKWAMNRQKGPWEYRSDGESGNRAILEKVDSGQIRITFINHSTFLIQTPALNILTDPVWSDRTSPFQWIGPERMRPPGIDFEDLPHIDLILISHNHYDHLDEPTMERIWNRFQPRILTPLGVGAFLKKMNMEKVTDMDWWDEVTIEDHTVIGCVPAQHFSGRGMFDRDATLWAGFVIRSPAGNVYFAGDTGYGPFFGAIAERYSPIHVALLPIGAYKPNWFMNSIHISPPEALRVHRDLKATHSIGMHFGTFPLADDGMDEPVTDLLSSMRSMNFDADQFLILKQGESRAFHFQPGP